MEHPSQSSSSSSSSSPYSRSNSTSNSNSNSSKPCVLLVLLFSILILLFIPSLRSSSSSPPIRLSIKSFWDLVNLSLVLLAILCGLLSRSNGAESNGLDKTPRQISDVSSAELFGSLNPTAEIRRMKTSSSYPDLRVDEYNVVPDSWRFFDDVELYRNRRSPVPVFERECKSIEVDLRGKDLKFGVPEFDLGEKDSKFEEKVEKELIFEAIPKISEGEKDMKLKEEKMVVKRRRRRSLESFPIIQEDNSEKEEQILLNRSQRTKTLEKFPIFEEEISKMPSKATRSNLRSVESLDSFPIIHEENSQKEDQISISRRRRTRTLEQFPVFEDQITKMPLKSKRGNLRSVESLPNILTLQKDSIFEHENVQNEVNQQSPVESPAYPVVQAVPPPPPPPPPAKHKRSGSNGSAKDLANAIAMFYKKKKGHKSKKNQEDESSNDHTNNNNNNSTSTPPPPPPLPSSNFFQIFSNKKVGSKSRKIHSSHSSTQISTHISTQTSHNHPQNSTHNHTQISKYISTTPPPPPPPPTRKEKKIEHYEERKEKTNSEHYESKKRVNSEYFENKQKERLNLSRYSDYPLPPRSPLPPPPPPPNMSPLCTQGVCENVSERKEEEGESNKAFCPSPDVNDKADLFIQRFRNGLKLEKINSIRKRKDGDLENDDDDEGEFMMVGSIFD